jgi:transcriptional regulator with XRE-family HTH domain
MELERLRQWLKKNNFSYGDLARAVGLDYNYIAMVMRGERPISYGIRWRFAQAFGFDVAAEVFGADSDAAAEDLEATLA